MTVGELIKSLEKVENKDTNVKLLNREGEIFSDTVDGVEYRYICPTEYADLREDQLYLFAVGGNGEQKQYVCIGNGHRACQKDEGNVTVLFGSNDKVDGVNDCGNGCRKEMLVGFCEVPYFDWLRKRTGI